MIKLFANVYKNKMAPELKTTFDRYDFEDEDGRQDIHHWSERRQKKFKGFRKSFNESRIFLFDWNLLQSFVANFNFMVILQMLLAGLITHACKMLNIVYDVHVTLFVSPIVFPLAFSINTDFQRREKVLEDLALFKSSLMLWFFCLRDWREACHLDDAFMKTVRNKLKCLLFHLREYLLTEKLDRRRFILRVIYEDLSDTNQLNEKVRASQMQANSPLVSRIVHLLNTMCLAFERLRVIREYRSPRSIRSFTKVLIFALPLILSPYYVHLSKGTNEWAPYYISIVVAFVFGALQGVQDKLDDPFDGMSEDDINLDTLDEWTSQSLEATVHRTYQVGRFQVSKETPELSRVRLEIDEQDQVGLQKGKNILFKERRFSFIKDHIKSPRLQDSRHHHDHHQYAEHHPYAGMLSNIQGNTTILRGGQLKVRKKSNEGILSPESTHGTPPSINRIISGTQNQPSLDFYNHSISSRTDNVQHEEMHPDAFVYELGDTDDNSFDWQTEQNPNAGVVSYLASLKENRELIRSCSETNSLHSPNQNYNDDLSHKFVSLNGKKKKTGKFLVSRNTDPEFYVKKESPSRAQSEKSRFLISNTTNAYVEPPLHLSTNASTTNTGSSAYSESNLTDDETESSNQPIRNDMPTGIEAEINKLKGLQQGESSANSVNVLSKGRFTLSTTVDVDHAGPSDRHEIFI